MYKYIVDRTKLENSLSQYLESKILEKKKSYYTTVLSCFAIKVNVDVSSHFKHDACMFIHGTSKMECFMISNSYCTCVKGEIIHFINSFLCLKRCFTNCCISFQVG